MPVWHDWRATFKIIEGGSISEDRRDHPAFLLRPVSHHGGSLGKEFGIVVHAKYNDVLLRGLAVTWPLLGFQCDWPACF